MKKNWTIEVIEKRLPPKIGGQLPPKIGVQITESTQTENTNSPGKKELYDDQQSFGDNLDSKSDDYLPNDQHWDLLSQSENSRWDSQWSGDGSNGRGEERPRSSFQGSSGGGEADAEFKSWIDEVKRVPMVDVVTALGIDVKHGMICCPRGEETPSCDVGVVNQSFKYRFKCHGRCGATGSTIDFLIHYHNWPSTSAMFYKAATWLGETFNIPRPARASNFPPSCVEYLAAHGLTPDDVRRYGCKFINWKYYQQFGGALYIPIDSHPKGQGARLRLMNPDYQGKYRCIKGSKTTIFKAPVPKTGNPQTVVLLEGEVDAMTVNTHTGLPAWSATSGCGTFPENLINKFDGVQNVFVCYDSDVAGRWAALDVIKMLRIEGASSMQVFDVRLPEEFKDSSQFFAAGRTKEDFLHLLYEAYTRIEKSKLDDLDLRPWGDDLEACLRSMGGVVRSQS